MIVDLDTVERNGWSASLVAGLAAYAIHKFGGEVSKGWEGMSNDDVHNVITGTARRLGVMGAAGVARENPESPDLTDEVREALEDDFFAFVVGMSTAGCGTRKDGCAVRYLDLA